MWRFRKASNWMGMPPPEVELQRSLDLQNRAYGKAFSQYLVQRFPALRMTRKHAPKNVCVDDSFRTHDKAYTPSSF